jgi:putative transposase
MSERKSCSVVGIPRSVYRYKRKEKPDEEELIASTKELASQNRRYGYRRIKVLLEREGKDVNLKRVHRIWKQEGLALKKKRPKRRIQSGKKDVINKAEYRNHVLSYNIVQDSTYRGCRIKILAVLDEYTRESIIMRVEYRLDSIDVVEALSMLFSKRGIPTYIRSDNGPEFVANSLKQWLESERCGTIYIEPGSPWENPYIESFIGKLRDECLKMNVFVNINHAKQVISQWREEYNEMRPHSSLGYLTPGEFVRRSCIPLRATPSEVYKTAPPIYPKS